MVLALAKHECLNDACSLSLPRSDVGKRQFLSIGTLQFHAEDTITGTRYLRWPRDHGSDDGCSGPYHRRPESYDKVDDFFLLWCVRAAPNLHIERKLVDETVD